MQKLYTVLAVITILICTVLFFKYESVNYSNVLPENHPEVLAVEKMIDKTSSNVPDVTRKKIALAIVSNGKFYAIPYKHLDAISFVESTHRPNMINSSGDYGLMQVNWQWWGKKFTDNPNDLLNVYKNVEVACKIINENKRMGYDKLASYHSFNKERQQDYQGRLKLALGRIQ